MAHGIVTFAPKAARQPAQQAVKNARSRAGPDTADFGDDSLTYSPNIGVLCSDGSLFHGILLHLLATIRAT